MRRRQKTVGFVLAGAVALASGAYALGAQAGDGSASAASDTKASGSAPTADVHFEAGPLGGPPGGPGMRFRGGPGGPPGAGAGKMHVRFFGLGRLATKLGVDKDKLSSALKELRDAQPDPAQGRDDFTKELAKELGIEQSKLDDALDAVRKRQEAAMEARRKEFEQKLADKLGISVEKVQQAFPDPPRHP